MESSLSEIRPFRQKKSLGMNHRNEWVLIIKEEDVELLEDIAERERAPMYKVGEVTGDMNFVFEDEGKKPD